MLTGQPWARTPLYLVAAALGLVAACAVASASANETEPNDSPAQANVLTPADDGTGNVSGNDSDWWTFTPAWTGWAATYIDGLNDPMLNVTLTVDAATGPVTYKPYPYPRYLLFNVTAGSAAYLRVNSTGPIYTYFVQLWLANTTSELSETANETEPDEVRPTRVDVSLGSSMQGKLGPWLDPQDRWEFNFTIAPVHVRILVVELYTAYGFQLESLTPGINWTWVRSDTWFSYETEFFLPPANRSVAFALHSTGYYVDYSISAEVRETRFDDPNRPSIRELEPFIVSGYHIFPRLNASDFPTNDTALSDGDGRLYGEAVCLHLELGNDPMTVRFEPGRTLVAFGGGGSMFISPFEQLVEVPSNGTACFQAVAAWRGWNHAGPESKYFISGIYFETISSGGAAAIPALFALVNTTKHNGPDVQLAFWAITNRLTPEDARGLGASNETIAAAQKLLDDAGVQTSLNAEAPPPVSPPWPGPPPLTPVVSATPLLGLVAIAFVVLVVLAVVGAAVAAYTKNRSPPPLPAAGPAPVIYGWNGPPNDFQPAPPSYPGAGPQAPAPLEKPVGDAPLKVAKLAEDEPLTTPGEGGADTGGGKGD